MSFYEFRSEQTGSGSWSYIFKEKTKPYHWQTCFNNILKNYLNEKLNFCHHIIERNDQMHIRSEICVTGLIILLILKYNWNH